jgi:iron complex outermembrane receptor protein
MYNNSKVAKAIRVAMMFGAGAAAAISAPTFAADEGIEEVERIEVTGSRIKRADMESASPVSVITTADMKMQGISNVADALQNLTAQSGGLTASVNNGGNGNSTVDLRGMGANRTLVLINGRRMIASGTGATATVDLNTIPMSAVKRIEVLKDGASAVYGSDAIAGVVNIIMRDDFEGLEFDASYAETSEGDGEESTISTTFGVSSDKGNIVVNLGYYDRGTVRQSDRAYSNCPIWEGTNDAGDPYKFCGGSGSTLGMEAFTSVGRVQFEPGGSGLDNPNGSGYHDFVGSGDVNDRYNYAATSYLSTPATRYNASVLGKYEITDEVSFFAEAYYTNRSSVQQMAPNPIGGWSGVSSGNGFAPSEHPEIYPFSGLYDFGQALVGTDPTVDNTIYPLRRMQEMGERVFSQEVNTIQITTGLDGVIADEYYWNAFYTYGRNSAIDKAENYINLANVAKSIGENCEGVSVTGTPGSYDVTGNDPAAPCINYYGLGNMSASDTDYLRYTDQGTSGTELEHYGASISGEVFDLPAGAVGVAFGVERRKESAYNQPDAFSSGGLGSGNAVLPTKGGYSVNEAYAEAIVPVLSDLPFAQSVDLELAMRYFDYDTFGSDTTWKVGLTWRMNDMIMLRSVASTAFRAPNVGELFAGQSDDFANYTDPCNGVGGPDQDPLYAAACANDVAANLIPGDGSYNQANGQVRSVSGGNPELGPETADTFTVGAVIEPLDGLSFTVDYYQIAIENVVDSVSVGTQYDGCYSAGTAAGGVGGSDVMCKNVRRNSATGSFDGTESFNENLAQWDLEGWDFNAQYNFEIGSVEMKADWEASYVTQWDVVAFEGQEADITAGVMGTPEWKHNFGLSAYWNDLSISYNILFVDEMTINEVVNEGADPADYVTPVADSFMTHTLSGAYQMNSNISLRFGIDNLTDEEPPYNSSYGDANTNTRQYKYIGRNYFVGTTITF